MVFWILTILAVISGIYCCDLPSFINSPLFVNDHNSILYGIGQSIIASYIFFLIQVVIVDKIRLHKCRDAAYYEISGIKSNMESISELLSGERDIKEYEEDKIKDHLKNMNFFQYGSGMDCNLKEMTVIEALIYNLEEIDKINNMIRKTQPDILIVGLGCPKQEKFMYHHCKELGVPISFGLGASFDFEAGNIKRAPRWMANHGLEWLFRITQDPKRMAKRYLGDDRKILGLAFKYRR